MWPGLPQDKVADSKQASALSQREIADRGWISFSVLTLKVMQCNIHHILLIEAVRKMHLGSEGKSRSHLWKGECQCPSVRRAHGMEHTLAAILGKNKPHRPTSFFCSFFESAQSEQHHSQEDLLHCFYCFEDAHQSLFSSPFWIQRED